MTKEEKQLLLKDLCGRLPYKPMVHADDGLSPDGKGSDYTLLGVNANKRIALLGLDLDGVYATHKEYIDNVKPYLRPMSSMTKKEEKEYSKFAHYGNTLGDWTKSIDWLNRNGFDYRDLIPAGLALPRATE